MGMPINFFYQLVNARTPDEFVNILYDARPSEIVQLEAFLAPHDQVTREFQRSESNSIGLIFRLSEDCDKARKTLSRALYEYFKQEYKRSFYNCNVTRR